VRLAFIGGLLLVAGILAVVFGLLPWSDALAVAERVGPVLAFVVAITVVAELAAEAGLFTAIAERLATLGRRRTVVLWTLVVLLAVACTVFLSLDTTAVLLTPVVVLLARHNGLPPLPFALTTVWLANTASLLLPVSNLTNLLAEHRMPGGPGEFALIMAAPAAVAVVVPCAVILLVWRRALTSEYRPARADPVEDRPLFLVAAVVVGLLIPVLVSGLPVWIPASGAAIVLTVAFALRRRAALNLRLVPWGVLVFAAGLFLVIETVHAAGWLRVLESAVGSGDGPIELLRLAFAGMTGANAINNLPAYLALEPLAGSPARLGALLIGVNAGALVTPWASLAILLWHERLAALGILLPWGRYMLLSLATAPATVVLATFALWAGSG